MLQLKNLSKRLGDFNLDGIDLTVHENEYFVILGPTGTGKTVILEAIAGMYPPDEGDILFDGQKITSAYPEERNIGFVYQDYALFPHLDVKDNILFGLEIKSVPKSIQKKRLEKIVKLLGIEPLLDRRPETLSGGEQQRVALARALIISPDILLLDEPLSALDPGTKKELQQDLGRIHAQLGTTTLHVTHDFNEALSLADRIAIMRQGKIIQTGSPQEVFHQPESNFVAEFVGSKNIFQGEIITGDRSDLNDKLIKINNQLTLAAITEKEGTVNLTVRPEDIIISYESFASSARNCYQGEVIELQKQLSLVEVKVNIGVELTAYITYHSLKEMELKPGKEVYLTFKASAVHVFNGR